MSVLIGTILFGTSAFAATEPTEEMRRIGSRLMADLLASSFTEICIKHYPSYNAVEQVLKKEGFAEVTDGNPAAVAFKDEMQRGTEIWFSGFGTVMIYPQDSEEICSMYFGEIVVPGTKSLREGRDFYDYSAKAIAKKNNITRKNLGETAVSFPIFLENPSGLLSIDMTSKSYEQEFKGKVIRSQSIEYVLRSYR